MFEKLDAVDILISDLHFLLGPLTSSGPALRPECAFLTDPGRYAEEYAKAEVAGFEHFQVTPLPRLKRHRLWNFYRKIAGLDPWHTQLPFLAVPRSLEVFFDAGGNLGRLPVEVSILLRPSGWSSLLDISPDLSNPAEILPEQLIQIMGSLRSAGDRPFLCEGRSLSVRGVFQLLGDRLKADLFGPTQGKEAWDLRQFGQHYVVSVACAEGEPRPYHPREKKLPGRPPLRAREKALVHGFLWGHPVDPNDLAQEESQGFMLTDLWRADFAVSRFGAESGAEKMGDATFVSLSDSFQGGRKRDSILCLAKNIRACWNQVFCLHRLLRKSAFLESAAPPLVDLRMAARQVLSALSETYTNSFCQDLFRKHRDLMKYAPQEGDGGGGEEDDSE